MYANIKQVGLPVWDDKDQTLAKALQREIKAEEKGLATKLARPPWSPNGKKTAAAAVPTISAISPGRAHRNSELSFEHSQLTGS